MGGGAPAAGGSGEVQWVVGGFLCVGCWYVAWLAQVMWWGMVVTLVLRVLCVLEWVFAPLAMPLVRAV